MSQITQRHNHSDHPTEEVLERFVLNRSLDEELENVESHILACEPCVYRLQVLEIEVAATKLALRQLQSEHARQEEIKSRNFRSKWFSLPAFSMAGAVAALILGVYIVPQAFTHNAAIAEVNLSAYRGSESKIIPGGHPLRMHLNAADLAEGPVFVQIVSDHGAEIWNAHSVIQHDSVDLTVPSISGSGSRFLRLYRVSADGELLREFAFQIK